MLQPLVIAIDDDTDDLFILRHILQKTEFAHTFQPFANGEAAVTALAALVGEQTTLDLPLTCFLDIKMAAMTGFEVLRWIRGQKALDAMPVFMLSSSDDPSDIETARELGAQGYLKKHPSIVAMQTVLEEAMEFAVTPTPKKAFVHWSYRFVESGETVSAK